MGPKLVIAATIVGTAYGFGVGTKSGEDNPQTPWFVGTYPNLDEVLGDLTYETFRSAPQLLKSGQVANRFSPADWVEGRKAIRYISTQVVDEDGNAVPESEIYVHHWFLVQGNTFNQGMCALPGYGTGAELNGQEVMFPYPYALITDSADITDTTNAWKNNIHFIRTTNVPADKLQPCVECRCADSTPENPHGSHYCPSCANGAQCWGMEDWDQDDTKTYYLDVKVGYTEVEDDTIPISVMNFDVTSTSPELPLDCLVEYDVKTAPGVEVTTASETTVPQDFDITLAAGHLHIGGKTVTMEHLRNGEKIADICSVDVEYNDDGHVVAIPFCFYTADAPYSVKSGDTIRLVAIYDDRTVPEGVAYHEGVMGLMWIFGKAQDQALLIENINAQNAAPAGTLVEGTIFLLKDDGTIELVCPLDKWCAGGINDVNEMNGALAFTYSKDAASGEMKLQQRILGDHQPGEMLNSDYPINTIITNANNVVLTFSQDATTTQRASTSSCKLQAVGASSVFGYHGSNRGVACKKHKP